MLWEVSLEVIYRKVSNSIIFSSNYRTTFKHFFNNRMRNGFTFHRVPRALVKIIVWLRHRLFEDKRQICEW